MAKISPEQKLAQKKSLLIERTAEALGIAKAEAEALLRARRRQSIRVNTLKTSAATVTQVLSGGAEKPASYSWYADGFLPITNQNSEATDKLASDGHIYIQNAASWLPVLALDPQPGETVLDMCAAPGGKTSHIAALSGNQAHITANDNSRPRLMRLQANMKRLGANIETYTLYDASKLSHKLTGAAFDKILLDAPCSGEGMLSITNQKELAVWSTAHIGRLQQLQKKLLVQAWTLVRPGGRLVYSTCTMAPEENEAVIDYLLRHNEDVRVLPTDFPALGNRRPAVLSWHGKSYDSRLSRCLRLAPSENIEAFFVCVLEKARAT